MSMAMVLLLATREDEDWTSLTQRMTAGMLVDSVCADDRVTNIDAFFDFMPIQSAVRYLNGEASEWWAEAA